MRPAVARRAGFGPRGGTHVGNFVRSGARQPVELGRIGPRDPLAHHRIVNTRCYGDLRDGRYRING
jgi:hypothetical protein